MRIRQATRADMDSAARLYDELHTAEEAGRRTTGWKRGVYPSRETAEEALERDDLFVLEEDGEILGAARINQTQLSVYRNAPWKHDVPDRQVCVLHTLVISPQAFGKGYGTAFVRFYERYAAEHGWPELRIDTNARNRAARALYAKLGYEETAVVPTVFQQIPDVRLVLLEKHLELWDLYDEHGSPTGETWMRGDARPLPEGRFHIVCDVLIRNADGEYLLTQRDPHKDMFPGAWEASAGGSALAGESPAEAAEREMLEETGLTPAGMQLIGRSIKGSNLYYSYLAETRCARGAVRLQPGETAAYRWVSPAELVAFSHAEIGMKAHNERYRTYFDQLERDL